MRGFAVGTLALIALYALVQPNAAKAVTAGGNSFSAGLRRLLSPNVAGVPQRKAAPAGQAAGAAQGAMATVASGVPGPGAMGRGVVA
jgi:hypothetical protein